MKLFLSIFIAAFLHSSVFAVSDECMHGLLFISSADASEVRVFDLDSQAKPTLVRIVAVPNANQPEIRLHMDSKKDVVAAVYRGQQDILFCNGSVSWIDAGVSANTMDGHVHEVDPLMLTNAK